MLFSAGIKCNQGGSPGYVKVCSDWLGVKLYAERDEIFLNKVNDDGLWIRNCIHLLTADSVRVEEVKQDLFVFGLSTGQGSMHLIFPSNGISHNIPPAKGFLLFKKILEVSLQFFFVFQLHFKDLSEDVFMTCFEKVD